MHWSPPAGQIEVISACDPLILAGALTPGDRVPAIPRNRIVLREGVPLAALESGVVTSLSRTEDTNLVPASSFLRRRVEDPRDDLNGTRKDGGLIPPPLDATRVLQSNDMRYLIEIGPGQGTSITSLRYGLM